ncbi:MAG: 2-nitropropane dioxygenase [Ignavibacteria bacterium]|nr:2-nitropropane dioxygenase [Ignavibacteria bacterium]
MDSLKIGNLEIPVPIVQGGMGVGISLSGLAGAVANEGALGVISTAGVGYMEPDFSTNFESATKRALEAQIRKARKETNGILGVNIMVALTNFDDLVKISIDEKIDIIFAGAGLPLNLPKFLTKDSQTKLVPIVSSARAAEIICHHWKKHFDYLPDAIVIEGPKAGGHLGFKQKQIDDPDYSLEKLLFEIKAIVIKYEEKYNAIIPIIVAGGIYTGEDMYKFLNLGASGVQLGTIFVTTHECDASDEFKNMYINAIEKDIRIINSPVGLPGRAVWNDFLQKVKNGEKHPINCHFHCLKTCDYKISPYCILSALLNAAKGNMKNGFAFSGANAYRATKIISVKETIQTLIDEFVTFKNQMLLASVA